VDGENVVIERRSGRENVHVRSLARASAKRAEAQNVGA
jgi:hypothetical protein